MIGTVLDHKQMARVSTFSFPSLSLYLSVTGFLCLF